MKKLYSLLLLFFCIACNQEPETEIAPWTAYDERVELDENSKHKSKKMRYRLIQSKVSDRNDLWKSIAPQIASLSEEDYQNLKPFILEQNIPALQTHVASGRLSYEKLTQWYLYRIVRFENDPLKALNAIISIQPNAVEEARNRDLQKSENNHPLYGIPVLLKDNINTAGNPTTAGAHALKNNTAPNAFIVDRLQEKGAVILGKTNLSEWANYLCNGCPNGYSAVGGQTLNPYGRRLFDTGGSSSGSGAAIAANYAVVAIGTETSGSILSPASTHALVGLKPTIGLLSRSGIVPISSTYDTPGPMTRNVIDASILLSAMKGEDPKDDATIGRSLPSEPFVLPNENSLTGLRFGVNKKFLSDSLFTIALQKIKSLGGTLVEFEPQKVNFENFGKILDADMQIDLKKYLNQWSKKELMLQSIEDVIRHNSQDSLIRIPYDQGRLDGVLASELSDERLAFLKETLQAEGTSFFETPMTASNLDAVLSINNWNAGHAAVAQYPCLTLSMGFSEDGAPKGLTFVARPFEEQKLLAIAAVYEQATRSRKSPAQYQ